MQQGGSLVIEGGSLGAGTVTGGGTAGSNGHNGSAYGNGIFIQGNQSIDLSPDIFQEVTITGVIADMTGSHDNVPAPVKGGGGPPDESGAGALTIGNHSGYNTGTVASIQPTPIPAVKIDTPRWHPQTCRQERGWHRGHHV